MTAMDMESAFVVTGDAHQDHVRAAHESIDRFAAAYPDAVQALSAWISAQLPAPADEARIPPAKARCRASSSARPVSPSTGLERSDVLSSVIRTAQTTALDPCCSQSVWAALVKMAEAKDKPAPLIGFSPEGIQYAGRLYQAEGIPDVLTFKNLADRMRRRRNRNPMETQQKPIGFTSGNSD